ncbi:HNH endonuclease [Lentisphaerota bacterium ZTH]|nr:HNH endonuclease [Lentisphaerota bacterium]WET06842.1 HNH endonuclease [Lentisphaerota bacterium ZTH]
MDDWIDIQRDEKHINRERKKARELRKTEWWRRKLQAGICHYCGKKFPPDELTMDHVVPVARGGRSNKGNIVACCKECNNDKKYLTPAEMLLKRLDEGKA